MLGTERNSSEYYKVTASEVNKKAKGRWPQAVINALKKAKVSFRAPWVRTVSDRVVRRPSLRKWHLSQDWMQWANKPSRRWERSDQAEELRPWPWIEGVSVCVCLTDENRPLPGSSAGEQERLGPIAGLECELKTVLLSAFFIYWGTFEELGETHSMVFECQSTFIK